LIPRIPRRYAPPDQADFAGHVRFGLLVLVTLFSLRVVIWHAAGVALRLIDLALSPGPLLIAERLNESSDPRWSVSVLLVALPLFLGGFAILAPRLEQNLPAVRSQILIAGLALLFLDTLVGLLGADLMSIFTLTSERSTDAVLLKMATTTLVLGAVLGYAGWEISQAAKS
jgi:hypothetical protein